MKFHDVANIFPLLDGAEFAALKEDIRTSGQRLPIITHRGKIIDGRNRFRACQELGIDPKFEEWDGEGSMVAFVISLNLPRRHLSPGQRAALAAELEPMLAREAKERQIAAGGDKTVEKPASRPREALPARLPEALAPAKRRDGEAREQAAKATGASPRYVQDAKAVLEKSPEVFAKVKSGEVTIPEAKRAIAPKAEPQPEPVTGDENAPPFATEAAAVDAALDQLDADLRTLSRLLDANKAEKKCRAPFAHFVSYLGGVGNIASGINAVRENLPGAANPDVPPGYIPRRSVDQRAAFAKGGR